MIDEKKLIEALIKNDGIDFSIKLRDLTPEGIVSFLQAYTDKLKLGFVSLINAQPRILFGVDIASADEEGWISTKEKLPKPFHSVLINIPSDSPLPKVHEGYITEDGVWISVYFHEAFTMDEIPFWMPIPDPPKAGGGA